MNLRDIFTGDCKRQQLVFNESDYIMKRNSSITLLRVIAVSLVIFTHICQMLNWVTIRSFTFGVPLFLLISGYLYGSKKITDFKAFFIGRWEKIIIPVWIYELFVFIYSSAFLKAAPTAGDVIVQLLNLQGVQNVFLKSSIYPFPSCEILWYTTIIMFCYFLVPFLQRIHQGKHLLLWFIAASLTTAGLVFAGIRLDYFFVFSVGYFLPVLQKKIGKRKVALWSFIVAFVAGAIRLLTRKMIDGTVFMMN